jgi:transcriptional regulator with XRE-family HTH domain
VPGASGPDDAAVDALAAELRTLRTRSGKSLRELQKSTFASDSALSRYLSGRALPPWRVVEALCVQGAADPADMRDLWRRARAERDNRRRPAAEPATDVHLVLVRSLAAIKHEADVAVDLAQRRGEAVPPVVLEIQRTSTEAIRTLRTAGHPIDVNRPGGRGTRSSTAGRSSSHHRR